MKVAHQNDNFQNEIEIKFQTQISDFKTTDMLIIDQPFPGDGYS